MGVLRSVLSKATECAGTAVLSFRRHSPAGVESFQLEFEHCRV